MPTQVKISHLPRRLSQAGWEEVAFRGRQLAWNRCEALRDRLGIRSITERSRSINSSASSSTARFFCCPADLPAVINTLRVRLPHAALEIVEHAERICSHRFDLLGYRDLDLGPRIDWHLDPVHQKRAPCKMFYKIPYLDFETVGDSKVTWELNRHQHFITLAKAYQLTGEDRYLQEFAAEFYDWQEQNPYLMGINWASSLEVALRSLSWIWARALFSGSPAFPVRLERALLLALSRNCRFIEHNLSTYFSRNTHLMGEAVALFFTGVLCPQLRRALVWQELGWKIILGETEHQIRSDGSYFEQATHYHTYALDLLLHARILASLNRVPIPERLDQKLVSMLDYLAALSSAGPTLRFGDDDGGRLFDPYRNRAEHLSDPLSTGAVLFHRSDWKAAASGLTEETLWLLGPAGVAEFDSLRVDNPQQMSRAFTASGVYLMASEELRLSVDAGPFGTGHCGHAHADALSITVAADGKEWLSDRGTCAYTGLPFSRGIFRGTAAHNTLRIDSLDQAEPAAPFKWERIPEIQVEHWWTSNHFDLLIASHSGYRRLESAATHRRLVFFVKPRFWLVIDSVEGKGEHQLELFWHLPSGAATLTDTALEVGPLNGAKFGIVPLADSAWSTELIDTWHSLSYGQKQPAPVLRCSVRTALPAEFATLLIPRFERAGRLERLIADSGHGGIRVFRWRVGLEQHSWVLAEGGQTWRFENIESDSRFAYFAQDAAGKPVAAFLWNGSFLSFNRVKIVDLPHRWEHFEGSWLQGFSGVHEQYEGAVPSLATHLQERAH